MNGATSESYLHVPRNTANHSAVVCRGNVFLWGGRGTWLNAPDLDTMSMFSPSVYIVVNHSELWTEINEFLVSHVWQMKSVVGRPSFLGAAVQFPWPEVGIRPSCTTTKCTSTEE